LQTRHERQTYPSKTIGGIHKILLTVALAVDALVVFFTIIYAAFYDTYVTYLATIDQALMTFSIVIYYIILVAFFVWLVQTHRAFREKYADYPITTMGGLVRMLPLVQLWGIANTFSTIGGYLYRRRENANVARRVHKLILPLYFFLFVGNVVNRILLRNPSEASDGMLLAGSIFDAGSIGVYLILTITIQRGVERLYLAAEQSEDDAAAPPSASANGTSVSL